MALFHGQTFHTPSFWLCEYFVEKDTVIKRFHDVCHRIFDPWIPQQLLPANQVLPGGIAVNLGPVSLTVFSIAIQIRWIFRFTLTSILMQWSLQNVVHGTTAVLSWHVQKIVAIWWPATELWQGEVSLEFELRAKNGSWNGPLAIKQHHTGKIFSNGSSLGHMSLKHTS